jgi:transcriptional regulator with PAS, ATPase and Fis domain
MFRKSDGFEGIIGNSLKMQRLFKLIEKIADDGESTVLIQGESGTGKELVARAIHNRGPRNANNFVPINCAAIPDDLLESELFGYVKGAFTGAAQNKMGRIQYATGGTLFLDEIGDMKPSLQAKLLRVIQEKEYEPVGGVKPIPVDVRIVAATHRDLEQLVNEGLFREDLYYRLSVVPLNLPPLRDRREDISVLLEAFARSFNRGKKQTLNGFEEKALEALLSYSWPGNVRELENLIQRLVVLHGGEVVSFDDLPPKYTAHYMKPCTRTTRTAVSAEPATPISLWHDDGVNFNEIVDGIERQLISQALARTGGNKKEAARLLNLKRTTLIEKIKKKEMEFDMVFSVASCA